MSEVTNLAILNKATYNFPKIVVATAGYIEVGYQDHWLW